MQDILWSIPWIYLTVRHTFITLHNKRSRYKWTWGPLSLRFTGLLLSVDRLAPLRSTASFWGYASSQFGVWDKRFLPTSPELLSQSLLNSDWHRFLNSSLALRMDLPWPSIWLQGMVTGKSATMSSICFYKQTYWEEQEDLWRVLFRFINSMVYTTWKNSC